MINKFKKIFLLFLVCTVTIILTGCQNINKQAERALNDLADKKASDYFKHQEKNGVYVAVKKLEKDDIKKYYQKNVGSLSREIHLVTITNESENPVIFHANQVAGVDKYGNTTRFENDLQSVMKKGEIGLLSNVGEKIHTTWVCGSAVFLSAFIIGIPVVVNEMMPALNDYYTKKQKYQESYYQVTYDKALTSKMLGQGESVAGFLVTPKRKFTRLVFKFQKTGEIEYFDIDSSI